MPWKQPLEAQAIKWLIAEDLILETGGSSTATGTPFLTRLVVLVTVQSGNIAHIRLLMVVRHALGSHAVTLSFRVSQD